MIDEDPSPEDLQRFRGESAWCPECGAELWDQAEFCPSCGTQVGGRTLGRRPVEAWFARRWLVLVALAALAALLVAVLW